MLQNPITLEEQRKVWSIHQSVNGITYYYNRATKKSQYQMPQCFKTTQQQTEHPDWKQYRTAQGKKFYYNATTRKSTWQLPDQVKIYKRKLDEQKKRLKQQNGGVQQEQLSEQDQKKKKLMQLFKQKSININTKWDSCIKICQDDERWSLLKISDKKKIFTEYLNDLKKVNEIQKKAKTQINKGQFLKMLKQAKFLTSQAKMYKVSYDFMTDPRWRILDQNEKQNVFQDYLDQLAQKEKQQAKQQKQQNIENLRLLMQEDNIKYNMRWDDFRAKYKNTQCYKNLHPYDRISTFVDYIMQAQKRQQQEAIKEKKLSQRYNRINFRGMLKQKLLNGSISYKTRWKTFVNQFKQDKNLINMMDPLQGSSAHQIFQNFMQDIRQVHKTLKNDIKQHFKKKGFKMTQQTNYQQFSSQLMDLQSFISKKQTVRQYFHKYFVQKIRSKNQNKQLSAKKASKKQKKLIFKIFKQLKDSLKTKYSIEDHMEAIEKGMKQQGIVITHTSIFKYYLAFLEGYDQQKNKKQASKSKSHSGSISSVQSNKKSGQKIKRAKPQSDSQSLGNIKKFSIPAQLKNLNLNQMQQEGQIKDDDEQNQRQKRKSKKRKNKKKSSSDSQY